MIQLIKGPCFVGLAAVRQPGGAYKGTSFRVCVAPQLCGSAAARARRFRFVGPAAVRPLDPSQFPVLLLLSVGRYCSSATGPPTRGPKRKPLQRVQAPGAQSCDSYSVFGPLGVYFCDPCGGRRPRPKEMKKAFFDPVKMSLFDPPRGRPTA